MIDKSGFCQERQRSFRIVFPRLEAGIVSPKRRRTEAVDLNCFALGGAFDDIGIVNRLRDRLADTNIAEERGAYPDRSDFRHRLRRSPGWCGRPG